MYLKFFFVLSSILLFILLSIYKLFISKQKRTEKTAAFISFIGAITLLYVLSGILFAIFTPKLINKFIIAIFAVSPFVIGRLATYEKENFYSFLQIFCVAISAIFTFIV